LYQPFASGDLSKVLHSIGEDHDWCKWFGFIEEFDQSIWNLVFILIKSVNFADFEW
jgi:hypothetical protein